MSFLPSVCTWDMHTLIKLVVISEKHHGLHILCKLNLFKNNFLWLDLNAAKKDRLEEGRATNLNHFPFPVHSWVCNCAFEEGAKGVKYLKTS